jgi:hypothetical protein
MAEGHSIYIVTHPFPVLVQKAFTLNYEVNVHSRTVHLDIHQSFFYLPTDAQEFCFKININIYIKMLRHVSV